MNKKITIAIILMGTVFTMQDVIAQVKIGYANPVRILNALPAVEEVDQQVEALIEESDQTLAQKATELQSRFTDYESTMSNLSEQERATREEELLEMNEQFEQDRETMMNQIRQRRSELMAPIIERMNTAMEEVAQEMGLDLILNEGTSTGDAIVFFANSEQLNITNRIIEKLQ
ncbi:MAG: OmpH family outer membrane protein [Gracilimonas sp.]|uniref:OmpH family outer membrane protein n=1 Tax=Gracilimonas sp. TaxID=1974203 RepID=UPI00199712B3|nr:OmpH family outer membrane protein [Gracilimonas sp.]MBD3616158.1 OmpH family outer membrane protein [Gracilimonas sp.]